MYLLKVTNSCIRDIINSLTITDRTKEVLNQVILRYDHSYVNFLFTMFSVYLKPYVRINSDISHLSQQERRDVYNTFKGNISTVKYDQIFVADKFDILFGMSPMSYTDSAKLTNYCYEDMYNRIENITGVEVASEYMEDMFENIEHIVSTIESYIVRLVSRNEDDHRPDVIHMHVDIVDHCLILAIY